jgi:hypothetical protein
VNPPDVPPTTNGAGCAEVIEETADPYRFPLYSPPVGVLDSEDRQ